MKDNQTDYIEIRSRDDRERCFMAQNRLVCYCGNCKQEDFLLPEDFMKEKDNMPLRQSSTRSVEERENGNIAYEFIGEEVHIFIPEHITKVCLTQNGHAYEISLQALTS